MKEYRVRWLEHVQKKKQRTTHNFENKASFTLREETDKLHSQDRDGKLQVWTWGCHKPWREDQAVITRLTLHNYCSWQWNCMTHDGLCTSLAQDSSDYDVGIKHRRVAPQLSGRSAHFLHCTTSSGCIRCWCEAGRARWHKRGSGNRAITFDINEIVIRLVC